MTLVADPELTMFAFTAELGSTSDEALNLLVSGPRRSTKPKRQNSAVARAAYPMPSTSPGAVTSTRSTPLELLFNLVVVSAITQVTS
jgi:hypothetical protein